MLESAIERDVAILKAAQVYPWEAFSAVLRVKSYILLHSPPLLFARPDSHVQKSIPTPMMTLIRSLP
jgi:hypothetical protein